MSFENHPTGTRELIADLRKQLAEKDKRIAELESWLKPFHGTAEDVKGYEIYNNCSNCGHHNGWNCKFGGVCGDNHSHWKPIEYTLNPDTKSGLPMIPDVEVNTEHPLFEPIWQAIKHWDADTKGKGYAGISGTDVMTIIHAIEKVESKPMIPAEEKKE